MSEHPMPADLDAFPEAGVSPPEVGDPPAGKTDLALADLIAAGLVTHEMICDPARLGAEAPALERLCALVAGAIYRIGPFHYAFRATAADLGGALGGLAFDDWTGALETALRETLGAEAVWLSATDLLAEARALEGAEEGVPEGALALLTRREGAVAAGLDAAPAGARAVIDAVYASETARLTAERARAIAAELAREMALEIAAEITSEVRAGIRAEIAGDIARDIAGARPEPEIPGAIAATLTEIAARLGALEAARPADPRLDRIEAALEAVAARLDAGDTGGALLADHLAEHLTLRLGAALGPRPEPGPRTAEFEETLGLALAEFLARIERATLDSAPGSTRPH
jgi:hypothetical protein